jgi:hypothetical protein
MFISLIVSELCLGQCSKCENEQREITPKAGKVDLRLFHTALLFIEIYQPKKFHVDISYSFQVMSKFKAKK